MNNLMQPPMQPNSLQGQAAPQPPQQPPQPPSAQQVADAHTQFAYGQKMLDGLIKKPDSELNLRTLFDSAAEMVLEYQTSGGKKGLSPQIIAAEMSDPNFPTAGSSASQIRQFLQNYFDRSVMNQAVVTHRFGGPQQQAPQQQTPQGAPMQGGQQP